MIKENVSGRFFVEDSCVGCGSCKHLAPKIFSKKRGDNYYYVSKQPENQEEEESCLLAMEKCPTKSIKDALDSEHWYG